MDEHCLVTSGLWICGDNGIWEFMVDKSQMTRVVAMKEGINLKELKERVVAEFYGTSVEEKSVSLSYWPPDSKELATGIATPPVVIANDGGIRFFFMHQRVNPSMNMFVKFDNDEKTVDSCLAEKVIGFTTTVPPVARHCNADVAKMAEGCLSTGGSFDVDKGMGFTTPVPPVKKQCTADGVKRPEGWLSTAGSKAVPFTFNLGVDLTGTQKSVAAELFTSSCGKSVEEEEDSAWNAELEGDVDAVYDDVNELDLRPRGYDDEFWEPVLEELFVESTPGDDLGNESQDLGDGEGLIYRCNTGSAFDHDVLVGGSVKSEKKTSKSSAGVCSSSVDYGGESLHSFGGNVSGRNIGMSSWKGVSGHRMTPTSVEPGSTSKPWTPSSGYPLEEEEIRRTLDSVADEEFDIPPLYNDLDYESETAEIPDLDYFAVDERIHEGKTFGSKKDCRIALAIYAIKNQFHFRQSRTRRHNFVLSCVDKGCDWRIFAYEDLVSGCYKIGKCNLDHICDIDSRDGFRKLATSEVIAALYKGKFGDPSRRPKPLDLGDLVMEDLSVSCSYMKCYRAAEKAHIEVMGTDDDSYLKLPEYLHMLKLANPGTVADLETEVDEEGVERFLYCFISFGSSKQGFSKLRRVLVVDGTHLHGKYKGVLLTACGQDANFQVFPLAYGVVDCEDVESWTWFFMKVERIIADSPHLTIISDRAQSIYNAKRRVFPKSHHAACIVHLARNVSARFRSKGLAKLVTSAGFACRIAQFREIMTKIKSSNVACLTYLEKIGVAHWSRAYFAGDRYNLMTSNICEQLNKALKGGRGSPILLLLIFIQTMMTRWFNARRIRAGKHSGIVTPEVDKVMTKNMKLTKANQINSISPWTAEVVGQFGYKHVVDLKEKKCSCKVYDKVKIPCGHAILAGDQLGFKPGQLAADCYKTSTWIDTYAGLIFPHGDPKEVDIPEDVKAKVVMPPITNRPPGRRKARRIPSTGEIADVKTKKAVPNRCGRCRGFGHNRTNCTVPI